MGFDANTMSSITANTSSTNDCLKPEEIDAFNTHIDMHTIPLSALRPRTRDLLCAHLDPRKILPAENSLNRDWQGLLVMTKVNQAHRAHIEAQPKPTEAVLQRWQTDFPAQATVGQLMHILEIIDRLDCLDDNQENFVNDARLYLRSKQKSPVVASSPSPQPTYSSFDQQSPMTDVIDHQDNDLTMEDKQCRRLGKPQPIYDALLIYSEDDPEDQEFAHQIIFEMTKTRNLKICTTDCILAGTHFEVATRRQLLMARCYRLIVVLSPATQGAMNDFTSNLAQSIGISENMRKLIPVVRKDCDIHPMFQHISKMYFFKNNLFDFWEKLYYSVQMPTQMPSKPTIIEPEVVITVEHVDVFKRQTSFAHDAVTNAKAAETPSSTQMYPPPIKPRMPPSLSMVNLSIQGLPVKSGSSVSTEVLNNSDAVSEKSNTKLDWTKRVRKLMRPKAKKNKSAVLAP